MFSPIFIVVVFFFFFLLCPITIVTSTPRYNPVDNIALNCGTSGNSSALDGRYWIGDMDSKFAPIEEPTHSSITTRSPRQGSSIDPVPYMTAHISYSKFTYMFSLTPGPKFVRLYFYPASYPGFNRSKALFTVKAGSFTFFRNFSASLLADSLSTETFFKEFCINVVENIELNLTFTPSPSTSNDFYAFINGIEIVSMPNYLYYSPPEGEGLPYIGQNSRFYVHYNIALETVFRLNVGGGLITPMRDTGMFREWYEDRDYLLSSGLIPRDPSLSPVYKVIPNYTAPDDIYRSAMTVGNNRTKNLHSNLTWGLPVDQGFYYLVRLHFCEFQPEIISVTQRQFLVYIDNQTAENYADIIMWSGGNGIPVYRDYIVMIQKKGVNIETKRDLFVALHPRDVGYADAILNGMEVFKLSNHDGNLAGPNPEFVLTPRPVELPTPTVKKSNRKYIAIGTSLGFLIVLSLSLVCCLVLWKLRKTKGHGSYYTLPRCWSWVDPNKGKSTTTKASSLSEEACHQISLAEIETAAKNFHEDF